MGVDKTFNVSLNAIYDACAFAELYNDIILFSGHIPNEGHFDTRLRSLSHMSDNSHVVICEAL